MGENIFQNNTERYIFFHIQRSKFDICVERKGFIKHYYALIYGFSVHNEAEWLEKQSQKVKWLH